MKWITGSRCVLPERVGASEAGADVVLVVFVESAPVSDPVVLGHWHLSDSRMQILEAFEPGPGG